MRQRQISIQNLSLDFQLKQEKWNAKLSSQFPLAPRDVQREVKQRMIEDPSYDFTPEYNFYNAQFGDFCTKYVQDELENMPPEFLEGDAVSVVGVGIGRGLGFIPLANKLGLRVNLYDLSDVAIRYGEDILQNEDNESNYEINSTHQTEIIGNDGEIAHNSRLIVMSQFLQILSRVDMEAVMRNIAEHFCLIDCRIIIIHPFDNPNAEWGDTTPYSLDEILDPLRTAHSQKGDKDKLISVTRTSNTRYFDRHNYTAFTLECKSSVA